MNTPDCEYLIIGGGFYGCSLALYLRSVTDNVTLIEAEGQLMDRASRVNQARVHSGFHYPRSVLTAVKSLALHQRFAADFPDAVVSNFQMLYAIARRRSKVSAKRFHWMYASMGAPIQLATPDQTALFDEKTIEAVYACTEYAFDFSILREHMKKRFLELNLDIKLNTRAIALEEKPNCVTVHLADGREISAKHVFNVTYAQINSLLKSARLPLANFKYELTEVALIKPPTELAGRGITIMDGPFFSTMPYPSENLYSLTHVRYTPHLSWSDQVSGHSPYEVFDGASVETRHRHMIQDGARYVPSLINAEWVKSLYDVKTVLVKNEFDDGRPILYQNHTANSRVTSIMGGKIDNIYDLFEIVRSSLPELAAAHEGLIYPISVPPKAVL